MDITYNYEKLEASHAALNSSYMMLSKVLDLLVKDGDETRVQNTGEALRKLISSTSRKTEADKPENQLLQVPSWPLEDHIVSSVQY